MRGDVRSYFFMNNGTIWLQGFFNINNSFQRFVIHLNISQSIFSDIPTFRQDHHNRFTRKFDLVFG